MRKRIAILFLLVSLLLGTACSRRDNISYKNISYKNDVEKALEQADLKDAFTRLQTGAR
jgi:hypothetical protein